MDEHHTWDDTYTPRPLAKYFYGTKWLPDTLYDVTTLAVDQMVAAYRIMKVTTLESSLRQLKLGPLMFGVILTRAFVTFPALLLTACLLSIWTLMSKTPTFRMMVSTISWLLTRSTSVLWSSSWRPLAESHRRIIATAWFAIGVTSSRYLATIATATSSTKPMVFVFTSTGNLSTAWHINFQSRDLCTEPSKWKSVGGLEPISCKCL